MKSSYSFGNKQVHQRFTKGFLSLVFLALIACESGSDSPPTPQDSTPEQFFSFQYEFQTSIDDPDISGQIRIGTRFDPFTLETVPIENSDLFAGTLTYEAGDKGTLRIAGKTYSSKNGKSGNSSQLETTQLELRQVTLEKEGFIAQTISNPSPTETNTAEFEADPNATQSVDLYLTARLGPQQIDGVIFFLKQSDRPLDSLAIIIPKDTPGQRLAIEEDFIYNPALEYEISTYDFDEINGGVIEDARFKPFTEKLIFEPVNGQVEYEAALPELEQEVDLTVRISDLTNNNYGNADVKFLWASQDSDETTVIYTQTNSEGTFTVTDLPVNAKFKYFITDLQSPENILIKECNTGTIHPVDSTYDLFQTSGSSINPSGIVSFEGTVVPIDASIVNKYRNYAVLEELFNQVNPAKIYIGANDPQKTIQNRVQQYFSSRQAQIEFTSDPIAAHIEIHEGSGQTELTFSSREGNILEAVIEKARIEFIYNPNSWASLDHELGNASGFPTLDPSELNNQPTARATLNPSEYTSATYDAAAENIWTIEGRQAVDGFSELILPSGQQIRVYNNSEGFPIRFYNRSDWNNLPNDF